MPLIGLRLGEGIDPARFTERTGIALLEAVNGDTLQAALEEDYLVWHDGRLAATAEGRLRLDALLAALAR